MRATTRRPPKGTTTLVAGSVESGAAGCGYVDGQGPAVRLNGIWAVHATATGDVILVERPSFDGVCSEQSPARLRKISPSGAASTLALGTFRGATTDPLTTFVTPLSVTSSSDGTLFVADGYCKGCVSLNGMHPFDFKAVNGRGPGLWQIKGGHLSVLAGVATNAAIVDGAGAGAVFKNPTSVVMDGDGALHVRDEGAHRRVTRDGQVSTKPWPGLWYEIAVAKGQDLYGIVAGDLVNLSTGTKLLAGVDAVDSMAVDSKGNVFMLSRQAGPFIRRWSPGQSALEVVVGRMPDGAPNVVTLGELPGRLVDVRAVAIGPDDALYVALGAALLKVRLD